MNQNKIPQPDVLVEVVWDDACGYGRGDTYSEDILQNPSKLLCETRTYGYIYSKDKTAILVLSEDNGDDKDFTVIPIKWIRELNNFRKVKKR